MIRSGLRLLVHEQILGFKGLTHVCTLQTVSRKWWAVRSVAKCQEDAADVCGVGRTRYMVTTPSMGDQLWLQPPTILWITFEVYRAVLKHTQKSK